MDLQYLTDAWLKKYRRRLGIAAEINYGDCYRWAYLAYQLHGGQLITVTRYVKDFTDDFQQETSHAFLKIGERYYDSEAPQGVDDWHELRYFKRAERDAYVFEDWYYRVREHKSALSFRRFWKFHKHKDKSDRKLLRKLQQGN